VFRVALALASVGRMHTVETTSLSEALAIYVGRGASAYPAGDFGRFDGGISTELRSLVVATIREADAVPVEWGDGSEDTLEFGTRHFRARLAALRPDLDDVGLDALAWRFSWEWR
jgi:hypothetical protein